MEIKEVIIGDGEKHRRFILVHNSEEVRKYRTTRENILAGIAKSLKALEDQKGYHLNVRNNQAISKSFSYHCRSRVKVNYIAIL